LDESLFPAKGGSEHPAGNVYESEDVSKITASTLNSSDLSESSTSNSPAHAPPQVAQPQQQPPAAPLESSEEDASELFMGGCTVYLSVAADKEKFLATVLLTSGGTRQTQFSQSVTHVIADTVTDELFALMKQHGHYPKVVKPKWIRDSHHQKRRLSTTEYELPLPAINTYVILPSNIIL
jgi:hypothetical protein